MDILRTDSRLDRLEKQLSVFRLLCIVQCAAILVGACTLWSSHTVQASTSNQVLHAKGLVIEDAQGRARWIVGAPFPVTKDRLRQDAPTNSMIFLDEQGHDRLTLGEETPAQIAGKVSPNFHRIAPGVGLVIHDMVGNERGGMAWLANGRATISLDRPNLDAIGAYVDDKTGFAGMVVEYPADAANDVNAIEIGTKGKQAFFRMKDTHDEIKASAALEDGIPRLSGLEPKAQTGSH